MLKQESKSLLNFIMSDSSCKQAILQEDWLNFIFALLEHYKGGSIYDIREPLREILYEIDYKEADLNDYGCGFMDSSSRQLGINKKGKLISRPLNKADWANWIPFDFYTDTTAEDFGELYKISEDDYEIYFWGFENEPQHFFLSIKDIMYARILI